MIKILVAEDDTFLGKAYLAKFTKAGFDIKLGTDGEEAIKILESFTPDVILLDLIMPKKDGFTVLEEVRKNPKFAKTPILVASNLGQKEDIDKAMTMGATGYFVKSDVPMRNIVEKVQQVLSK